LEVVPSALAAMEKQFGTHLKVLAFNCPTDGFCGEYLKIKGFPEVRFYFRTEGYFGNFVRQINPREFTMENLFMFV
jgi:hypothetical protein